MTLKVKIGGVYVLDKHTPAWIYDAGNIEMQNERNFLDNGDAVVVVSMAQDIATEFVCLTRYGLRFIPSDRFK